MTKETGEGLTPTRKIKLTLEQWLKIKSRYLAGDDTSAIAKDNKISRQTIWTKAKREGWKHGSRKEALAEKIGLEVEKEIIDEYKCAVKEANKKHFFMLEKCAVIVNNALAAVNFLVNKKIAKLKEFESAGVDIPDDFSITEEVKLVAIVTNTMLKLIGRDESEILGVKDKPMLVEDKLEKGLSEIAMVLQRGIDRRTALKQEEKDRVRAEVKAEVMAEIKEAKGGEQSSHSLQ